MQISGPTTTSRVSSRELGWVVDPMGIFVNPKQKEAIQKKKNTLPETNIAPKNHGFQ